MRVNEKMRKALSILLCLCMLLQNAPVMAFAVTTDNLCDHHTEHTAECGYREGSAGSACAHEHSEDCYAILECLHTCGEECADGCTHECTVENGCITMEPDCRHVHGDCGYSEGTAEVPCGHVHNESCGYAEAVVGNPCANAETDPECDHSGDCGYVAAVEGQPCGHTACDDTCGYAPATEGTPCTHVCEVKVDSDDSCYKLLCSHKGGGHDDVCGYTAAVSGSACTFHCHICHVQELVDALPGEVTAENAEAVAAQLTAIDKEKASLSDEELAQVDFAKYTTAAEGLGSVYAAVPAVDPTCNCETKCAEGSVNSGCAVCGAEGADLSVCTGTETTASGVDDWRVVNTEAGTVTIDGTLGGKTTAIEEDINALLEAIKGYVASGITTIIVTGSEPALIEMDSWTNTAIGEAIYRLSGSDDYDENNPYNGKIDLILQDVTEIVDQEFYSAWALNSITLPQVIKMGDEAFHRTWFLKTITFESVLTEVNETGGVMFAQVGKEVDGCDLILNCGQMDESSVPAPDLTNNIWKFKFENEFKSITLTHSTTAEGDKAATCTSKAYCSVCESEYGEVDRDAHSYGDWVSNGDNTHIRTCANDSTHIENDDCSGGKATCTTLAVCENCGASYGERGNHSTAAEGDRAATCKELAYCSVCQKNYGEVDSTNHASTEFTYTANEDGTTHKKAHKCCDATAAETEAHTMDIATGKCSACGADMTVVATVTDGTNTYYAADAATLNQAVTAILETGSRTFTVELPADAEAGMITAIRRAICDTEGVADGSIHLTLKGVTSIPGTTNWDGVAFGPRNAQWDENNVEIVSHEEVTQLASVNLPDVTEIGAQAFYFCENLVTVSAPKAQTIGAQALGYTALTSVEFPELTTIPTDMFSGTWTLSSAKFPKVTTIEQGGLLVGAKFTPENNPTPFPLELTAEGDITFNGSNHFNIASQNYSGKVDLVLCCDKKDAVTFNEDGTATWQVREDLSYTFKSITFKHSYVDGKCTACGEDCAHTGGTATCTTPAVCESCGASYGEVGGHTPAEDATYTDNSDGTHSYTCCVCEETVTESHTFTDGACTGCGVIGGYCGEEGNEQNVIWTYANGTLTISGTGAIADQRDNYDNRPWEEYVDQITTIVVNDGITSIGEDAFCRFQKLTTAKLPDSLTTISQQAFYGCTALKTVNFPANLKTIEGWAFLGCALESVTLPEGLTTIGYRAFSECKNLTSVTVPASVTTIDEGAFGYSPAKITVAEDNLNYSSDEHGVLFDKDKTTLIYCRPNIEVETYTIPSTVTEICKEAFYGCKNLATITIPDGVQKIGSSAFGGCEALTTITIPAGVTTIEANTFYHCTALTAVTIPAGVTTIDMWAFSGCTALTTVTIPASVTSIAYNAFSNCSALTTVNVPCTWDGSLYTFDESVTLNKVHNWVDGTCTACGAPCDHKDSTHTTSNNNGDGTHSFTCSVCVNTVIEAHTGGTATCTEQAKCEHCGASYGDFAAHSMDYVADEEANTITYRCGTCDTKTVTFTLVIPTGAVYGSSGLEVPHYDCSDKTYQDDSPVITLDGALLKDFVPGAKTYEVVMTWGGKTVSGEYTIAKADVGITAPTPNTLTYTGEAHNLITQGEVVGGTMVYSLTENGEYTTTIPRGTNAGDYTVWYYVQGDANHKDSAKDSVAVTIEKATVTVTADAKSKTYGTDNPALTYTASGLVGSDTLTGALATTATKTSNVGEYDITVGSLANSNYTIDFVGAKLTITKAASSCTAPVAVSSLTFNGGNQNLITAGTATGGTMQYSLDGSNWSETIPTGKDADTYTVYYKVVGDGNHNDADGGSVSVTIAPKVITNPVIEGIDAQYLHTGSAITPVPTAVKDGNTVIDPSEYTLTYENNINEGAATLKIVDVANGNYNVSGSKTFQIVVHAHVWNYSASGNTITATCNGNFGTCPDAEQSFTLNAPDVGYSGNPVEAEVTRDGTDLTFTLHYTGINYDSADAPTNAGDYTVTMTVGDKSVSDTFTISPKDISKVASCQFSLTQISFVYSGKAPVLNVTGVDSSIGSYTMQEGTDYTVGTVQVNAGSHKLTVTGIGNYTGTVELDYTITAKEVSIIGAAIQSVTYDPNGYTLTVTGVTFNGVVDGENLAYTAEAILGNTNAFGEQDATVTVTLNNSNYNLVTATYQTKVTINKAAATVTAAPTPNTLTYTGEAQYLISAGEANGGTMQYSTDNQTWSTTIPQGTDAGKYTVYYKVVGDENHSDTAVDSIEVTIDKAQAVITVDTTTINITYGETVNLPAATTNFGTVVCDKTAADLKNVGSYTVTYTVAGTENFEGATKTLTVKVEQLAVAEPTVTGTYTYTGKELTAQLTGVESYMTVASGNKGTNAGNYEVEVTLDGNHKWADGSDGRLQWTIAKAKAEISVNTDSITVTYGETVALPEATTNFGDVACSKKVSDIVNAGSYTVTYTVAGTDNYDGDTKSITVIVNAKAITVTADALSKTYGDADPKLTYKIEGLVNGDELTGELKRVAGENVGSYTIEQNTLTAGDNYTITYTGANLTINPKAITEADVELNGSLTYTGKELTQPITVTEGITYTVIGDKATNVGTYVLTVQGTGNYTGEVKLNWSIKEMAAVVGKTPTAKELTYIGAAQALVNAGTTADGKLVYSLSENGEFTDSIPTGQDAGEYTVWYYVQGDANHSDTAKASIKVMIHRASATFEITNNVVLEGTEIKLTVTSEPANVSHEVSYRQDGKSVTVPAAVGEYDVYVTITDSNYRHATSTDGSALKVGVLSIYKEETPETYTLSYAAGGATGTMAAEQAALAGTVRILPESTFTAPKDENDNAMLFAGWSDGTAVYQPGEKYVQPEQNVTMTAVWQVEEHNISGMVKQYVSLDSTERVNREGVTITLMLGSRQITQTVTDENGNYQFEHCLQGTYNLIAEYEGIKQTIKVVLGHSDQTGQEIDLPAAKTNTAVAVQPGTPAVVVGGMDDMMTKTDDTVFTEEDKDTVEAGGEVEIKMDIKENPAPANKAEIDQKVEDSLNTSATVELYIDLDLTKTVRDANGTEQSSTAITESNVLLENIIFLPGHLQGKDAYHVFRQHGNDVEEMKELPAGTEVKEEGFVVDRTNHTITIYSRKYSTFAIVTSEVFTITFDANGGTVGTSTMETDEKLNTLPTPERSGFKFIGWFTEKTGGTEVDTSTVFTQDTTVYAQWERIGYQIEFPTTDTTGTIKAGGVVEIDGKLVTIDNNGEIWMPVTGSKLLVSYKFNENADPHKEYPTAMYAWFLKWEGDTCEAIRIPELDNFMTYKGTSIRVNHSSDGIRFFTAVPVDALNKVMKGTLLTGELEGYKLVEMGTLYKWAETGTELTIANGAKSYVYGGSAGSTYRQFSKEGSLSWFTGMLTDLPGDAATLAKDILSRPYAVFENADGDQITLYGGSIQRSIYYVALQNKDTWASGTAYDNYVEKIISAVEAAKG